MADPMDASFVALGSPARRKILDIVKDRPGCGVKHVAGFFKMSRIGVMRHLRILVQAGLVISKKEGRSRRLHFNCVPIQMIYDRWTTEYSALWASSLTKVKYRVETREKLHGRR
jgi:DNA-binding transcriptional ArsR family regulator